MQKATTGQRAESNFGVFSHKWDLFISGLRNHFGRGIWKIGKPRGQGQPNQNTAF